MSHLICKLNKDTSLAQQKGNYMYGHLACADYANITNIGMKDITNIGMKSIKHDASIMGKISST